MEAAYLGIDVGSISVNLVLIDDLARVLHKRYLRAHGQPMRVMQEAVKELARDAPGAAAVRAVGTTGSGRHLAGILTGAEVIKNEITAHAVAALHLMPEVRSIIEIGGQDSKCIMLNDGVLVDFAMNAVCAAGTGSFLDQQAHRLGIPIEEFGEYCLRAVKPVKIASRCTVFAESDMIHKQQMGHTPEDIIAGLCESLVRNYLSNLVKSRRLSEPIVFQGGVAANTGMRAAFERVLGAKLIVPALFDVMGAFGAALLARDFASSTGSERSGGLELADTDYRLSSFDCEGCSNNCEIMEVKMPRPDGSERLMRWGDRCGKWELISG